MSHYKLKGTSGILINRSFPFTDNIVLGSSADCDVRLDDPGVAARQAEIRLEGGALVLRAFDSKSGTLLNGEPVSEAPLASGDEIRIGANRFMLQAPGLRPERVLTTDAVQQRTRRWPRVLAWAMLAAAACAVALLKFKPEWIDLLLSIP